MKIAQLISVLAICGLGLVAKAQFEPIRTCSTLASHGNSNAAAQCNATVAGKYLSTEADNVCNILARQGYSSSVVECIKNAVSAEFEQSGLEVCKELATKGQTNSTALCLGILRNKMVDQRVIGSCTQLARQGYSSSVTDCVRNSIVGDLGSGNIPFPGNPSDRERDARILSLVTRTKEAVLSRNTESALRLLERIEQIVQRRNINRDNFQVGPIRPR